MPSQLEQPPGQAMKDQEAAKAGLTDWERDRIRRRAYAIWCERGYPNGQDHEIWAEAELQELKRMS